MGSAGMGNEGYGFARRRGSGSGRVLATAQVFFEPGC
jgi:hypothetical protein